jgi:hypothetical protein
VLVVIGLWVGLFMMLEALPAPDQQKAPALGSPGPSELVTSAPASTENAPGASSSAMCQEKITAQSGWSANSRASSTTGI